MTDRDASPSGSAPSTTPVGDKTIRVTLGRPEPSEARTQSDNSNGKSRLPGPSTPQWKAADREHVRDRNEKGRVPTPRQLAAASPSGTALAPKSQHSAPNGRSADTKARFWPRPKPVLTG